MLATAGLDTIGVRVPDHPVARAILAAFGGPVVAPSANRSGHVSPTTAAHVLADLRGRIDLIVDGGPTPVGVESTIVACLGAPVLLRPGGLPRAAIEQALGEPLAEAPADTALQAGEPRSRPACSPRTMRRRRDCASTRPTCARAKRCSPSARAVPAPAARRCSISRKRGDLVEAAANLFSHLRALDAAGVADHCGHAGAARRVSARRSTTGCNGRRRRARALEVPPRSGYFQETSQTSQDSAMTDTWKLQDAKARFSELVRRARAGKPQHVTVHGKDAVIVARSPRFEVRPKPPQEETMAGFIERSKKYRRGRRRDRSRTANKDAVSATSGLKSLMRIPRRAKEVKWLLDTNVISEGVRSQPNRTVVGWIAARPPADMAISIVTVAELRDGARLPLTRARRRKLVQWVDAEIATSFRDRTLPLTTEILVNWLGLARQIQSGRGTRAVADLLIAATAQSTTSFSSPATPGTSPIPVLSCTIRGRAGPTRPAPDKPVQPSAAP